MRLSSGGKATRARSIRSRGQSASGRSSSSSASSSCRPSRVPRYLPTTACKNPGARFAAFSTVAARVTAFRGSASSDLISFVGRGVVVTTCLGCRPSRSPNCSMSQVSCGRRHLQSSSHQAALNCGPRKDSGSSAEKSCAIAPFGQVTCRRDGSKHGRSSAGCTARRPETPSTITLRASAKFSATKAMRASSPPGSLTSWRTHSAPARVFPAPRPPNRIQLVQAPPPCASFGGNWSSRAHNSKS